MKILILIIISLNCYSQDTSLYYKAWNGVKFDTTWMDRPEYVKVKILKIKGHQVWMKTIERPRVKLFTFCQCPYKKKQILWIKKPS